MPYHFGLIGGGPVYVLWAIAWTCIISPALIGYAIARLARGREMIACFALAIFHSFLIGYFIYRVFENFARHSVAAWSWGFLRFTFVAIVFNEAIPAFVFLSIGAFTRKRAFLKLSPI